MQNLKWQNFNSVKHAWIPENVRNWLFESNSLTARLKRKVKQLKIKVLFQHWGSAFLSEQIALGLQPRQWVNIREVLLICDEKPWMYARTIIPKETMSNFGNQLLTLGTKPLGEILFEYPDLQRSPFEIAIIHQHEYPFLKMKGLNAKGPCLFARRSIFFLAGYPLLLSEVFTTDFCFNG